MLNYSCTMDYFFCKLAALTCMYLFMNLCLYPWARFIYSFLILYSSSYSVRIMPALTRGLENLPYFLMLWNGLNNREMTCFWKLNRTCQENHFKLFCKDRPVFNNYSNFSYDYCSFQVLYVSWNQYSYFIFF